MANQGLSEACEYFQGPGDKSLISKFIVVGKCDEFLGGPTF